MKYAKYAEDKNKARGIAKECDEEKKCHARG
jgi:hypothetical protein